MGQERCLVLAANKLNEQMKAAAKVKFRIFSE
jgi:hypothetical protein